MGVCNGPGGCQVPLHSRVIRSAGLVLLSGVGARPPPDGVCCAAEARKELMMS
jgi:hypothetical protein